QQQMFVFHQQLGQPLLGAQQQSGAQSLAGAQGFAASAQLLPNAGAQLAGAQFSGVQLSGAQLVGSGHLVSAATAAQLMSSASGAQLGAVALASAGTGATSLPPSVTATTSSGATVTVLVPPGSQPRSRVRATRSPHSQQLPSVSRVGCCLLFARSIVSRK